MIAGASSDLNGFKVLSHIGLLRSEISARYELQRVARRLLSSFAFSRVSDETRIYWRFLDTEGG